MIIDDDVARVSKHFGIDSHLIQAVVQAEGGGDRIIKAVQCSIPSVKTREEALEITCRSAVRAMCDYTKAATAYDFVQAFAGRWAPPGAKNDPTGLNRNWPVNVLKLWLGA